MTTYRIVAPHFVAGFDATDGKPLLRTVTHAAPILHWTVGKPLAYVQLQCLKKGWKLQRLESQPRRG